MTDEVEERGAASAEPRGSSVVEPRSARATPSPLASFLRETVLIIALSLVIATLVRIFLVQAFLIPSQSMENTLRIEDRVLVSKLSTRFGDIQRGDVVVFEDPGGWLAPTAQRQDSGDPLARVREAFEFVGVLPNDAEGHLIKRVVGVGGDEVSCCDNRGRVSVNGVAIDEPYVFEGDVPSTEEFDVTVPDGSLWVMGDHRSNSGDSRVHGFVPEVAVTGRAFAVVWPVSRWRQLERPDDFAAVPAP